MTQQDYNPAKRNENQTAVLATKAGTVSELPFQGNLATMSGLTGYTIGAKRRQSPLKAHTNATRVAVNFIQ